MAVISGNADTKTFQIQRWLGINENKDGDTRLKLGEAAESRNWRVTQNGSLQVRPGTKAIAALGGKVRGMWYGNVAGTDYLVAAGDGKLWKIDIENETKTSIGTLTDDHTEFFGYSEKLYILNGHEYKVWDGTTLSDVTGYVPVVVTECSPGGGGTQGEQINKLNAMRRVWFSPDGSSTEFTLPEQGLYSIDYVKNRATGASITFTADAEDLAAGKFHLSPAPDEGVDTIEVEYTASASDRSAVTAMRFSETFNGTTDNRVFLYGDGSNTAIYSGLDQNGKATAEYFPDLNVMSVGEANTPITSLIRHYSRLIVYKTNSTYSVQYGTVTLENGSLTAGFYVTPVNRSIGNLAPGQVKLVLNNPYSMHSGAIYEWKSSNSGNLSIDERNAKRISDRVDTTLQSFPLKDVFCFDFDYNQEHYTCYDGTAVIHNYDQDAWYIYTNFDMASAAVVENELYIGTSGGEIRHVSRTYRSDRDIEDNISSIDAFWRSGSMAFNMDFKRKYSSAVWVAIMPESGARVTVTARSNRKSDFPDKVIAYGLSSFSMASFNHFSFGTNRQSQVKRVKLKVKKYTYYQLVFESNDTTSTATIVGTDILVRYSGDVK